MKKLYSICFYTILSLSAITSTNAQSLESVPAKKGWESFVTGDYIPYAGTVGFRSAMTLMFSMCSASIDWNDRTFIVGDDLIKTTPHWVRDHALALKSTRYVKKDLTSFIDLILAEQTPEGFFYEILAPDTDQHIDIVAENCRKIIPNTRYGLSRLEIEADIEYQMVEAVYYIWQATGDDKWLEKNLPKIERGINYMTTSPIRWDKKYNLAKRVYTIDTWDFTNRYSSNFDRSLLPTDPMGIMHGDNTGLYYAMTLLAKMNTALGNNEKATHWEKEAKSLKDRINKHLWNGKFYKHYLVLDDPKFKADFANQMSLSNAYNTTRGTASPEQVREILKSYNLMRTSFGGKYDDFRTLNPPFEKFMCYPAHKYTNGAIGFFLAGQLAVGAFENGMETYGFDILERVAVKILKDGKISFLYDFDGSDVAGGPRCWVGSELMFGLVRGLAGVIDQSKLFEDVTISPRWVVSKEKKARVFLKYPVSDAYIDYSFEWDKKSNEMFFSLYSKHKSAKLRVLLPAGADNATISVAGKTLPSKMEDVFGSKYLIVENFPSGSKGVIKFERNVEMLPKISLLSETAILYFVNNFTTPKKCTLTLEMSGYKPVVSRTFTLYPHEKYHVETMALTKKEADGSCDYAILEVDDKKYKFPITEISKSLHHYEFKNALPF